MNVKRIERILYLGVGIVMSKAVSYTIDERLAAIEEKKPHLLEKAKQTGGRLRVYVFKAERMVELNAPGWAKPQKYPMTGFSGALGPKLKEGDRQIPEGCYGIEYLNPNSRFYLSLKVSYPNEFDREHAKNEGRTNPGGDIMIHGKDITIGCISVGDDAIEDIFYLANAVGVKNVKVVISPYDMRNGRKAELEVSEVGWYNELCEQIFKELKR
jgi:murein L,D-transpeptidase YafK